MLRIVPTKLGPKLSHFQLQVRRRRARQNEHLFQLDTGFPFRVQLVDDVGEALK